MSRYRTTLISLARRLLPTPADFAAAAALHDPGLLLQLQVAKRHAR
jgi:hypothetical protein